MFYALIASLPHIQIDRDPPFSSKEYLNICSDHVSDSQLILLNALVNNETSSEIKSFYTNQWFNAEIQLKNAISKQRAQNRGIDAKPFIHDHANFIGFIETKVQEAFNTDNPFDLEQSLDQTRWNLAEEFIGADNYGFSKLAAYAIQLRIVNQWYGRSNEKGQTNLEDTITKNTESDSAVVKL